MIVEFCGDNCEEVWVMGWIEEVGKGRVILIFGFRGWVR